MRMFTCPKLLAFKQLLKINIVDRRIQEKNACVVGVGSQFRVLQ